jgi:phage terminase Nu1 subunit (DNA packaging protein)
MSIISLSQLSDLTGQSYRTIKKRLTEAGLKPVQEAEKRGLAILFESADALPILYRKGCDIDAGLLDLSQERAQLAKEQSRRLQRENDVEERKLIPLEELVDILQDVSRQAVSILDALPLNIKRRAPALRGKDINYIRSEIAKSRNIMANIKVRPKP